MIGKQYLRNLLILLLLACFVLSAAAPVFAARSVTIAVFDDLPPFYFADDQENTTGMFVEMIQMLADDKNLSIEYEHYPYAREAITALENREVDVVLGALPSDVINNKKVCFSKPLATEAVCVMASKETTELYTDYSFEKIGNIAFELGTIDYAITGRIAPAGFLVCSAQSNVYSKLLSGDALKVAGVKTVLQYMLAEDGLEDAYVVTNPQITNVEYSLLMRTNDASLHTLVDDGITQISSGGRYVSLRNRWVIDYDRQDMEERITRLLWALICVLSAGGLIFLVFSCLNQRLKRMVSERTKELNDKILELEASDKLRNRLVEHIPAGSLLLTADGTIQLANPIAMKMAGIWQGAQPQRIEDMPVFSEIWKRIFPLTAKDMDSSELINIGAGSDRRIYRYQYHSANNQDLILTVEDVTLEEQIKREEFEESKNQTLNRVIAGVAHEIKNPLTTIRTFSSMIEERGGSPEFQDAFREYVPEEVDRINKMVETLINYARPPRENKTRILLDDIIRDSLAVVYLSSKDKIHVVQQFPENAYVFGNGDQLRQAVTNLLINSVQSIEEKIKNESLCDSSLEISITGKRSGEDIIVEILDQGEGMSEEEILRCMDPFFTTKSQGTGMGLALTKQFLKENGGKLEIESVLGEYTKMILILKEDKENEAEHLDN